MSQSQDMSDFKHLLDSLSKAQPKFSVSEVKRFKKSLAVQSKSEVSARDAIRRQKAKEWRDRTNYNEKRRAKRKLDSIVEVWHKCAFQTCETHVPKDQRFCSIHLIKDN